MAEGLGSGKQAVSPSSEVLLSDPELSPMREGQGPGGVAGRWISRKSGS